MRSRGSTRRSWRGRAELLGSAVVGRQARLAAALVVGIGAAMIAGAIVSLALTASGLGGLGALTAGTAIAGVGAVFAAVAAVTAQVAWTARGANGAAGAAIALAFLLRAVGDALGEVASSGVELISAWPSWGSPIGWGQQVRPYHQDAVSVLALFAVAAVALVGLAVGLSNRRDVGAGMIAARPGPASAGVRPGRRCSGTTPPTRASRPACPGWR
ncbi:hypothetical protein BH23ACT9_BH23ACT9_12940 [soil metagenome]